MSLYKIPTSDPTLSRVQDQLLEQLNPVLRRLLPRVVKGSRSSGEALSNLLAALADAGIIRDETIP